MPYHPTYRRIRAFRETTGFTPLYTMSVELAREEDAKTEAGHWEWIEHPDEVLDLTIPGPAGELSIRVYRPTKEVDDPLPVLVYFFGGGFVVGSLDTSDSICRALSVLVPCVVVSIGYRLAPEHPFPAAINDCYAGVQWVADHAHELGADGGRLAVAGDSCGGNIAAVVSLMARDRGGPPISAQTLIYGPFRSGRVTKSMRDYVDPMFFNGISTEWFWSHYLADPADGESPYASPLNAADHSGLPPTLMITAEFCPLLDEGEEYAEALTRAGVPVQYHRYDDLPHGFVIMAPVLDIARQAFDEIATFLRERLGDAAVE